MIIAPLFPDHKSSSRENILRMLAWALGESQTIAIGSALGWSLDHIFEERPQRIPFSPDDRSPT